MALLVLNLKLLHELKNFSVYKPWNQDKAELDEVNFGFGAWDMGL